MLGALFVIAAACGDRSAEVSQETAAMPPASVIARPESAVLGAPPVETVPAAFVSACVSGDPFAGVPWTIAQVGESLTPLTLVPIETLPSRDSARLAARLSRAADVLPSDTTVADFRGLPVAVRSAWQLAPAFGDTIVVALVGRRLPMESNPLEELFFIVAAPGQRQGVRDPLVETWVMREVAAEEMITVRELLAAFVDSDAVTLVVGQEAGDGVRTELLSRRAGVWRLDWSGPLPACMR
jgi:hypothetical protein